MKRYYTYFKFTTFFLFSLSSCYRMPTDEEYSVLPMTNNPDITGNKGDSSGMPSVGY